MKVALFIPCYVDQFYPSVAISTMQILEKCGCEVIYPLGQTCCGQPMANAGCESEAKSTYRHFVEVFKNYEHIVCPSGSCAYHVRKHYDIIEDNKEVVDLRSRVYDICEFLVDVLDVRELDAGFPHRVGLHQSCHGLRGLRLSKASERMTETRSKPLHLLRMVNGLELVDLIRTDECCGFGGTFAVTESDLSVYMGEDRVKDHITSHAEYITAGDMSCLMHLDGIIKKRNLPIQVIHIAEILNSKLS